MQTDKRYYCSNCNQYGHNNKRCKFPIKSFGIICGAQDKYLLVQKKFTSHYVKLINCFFNLEEYEFIKMLIEGITSFEYYLICKNTYDTLWKQISIPFLITNSEGNLDKSIFNQKKEKFQRLCRGYTLNDGTNINLHDIYKSTKHKENPPWEFPKGRRLPHEHEKEVAVREFYEETGVKIDTRYVANKPIEHSFKGSDHNCYSHTFFYYKIDQIIPIYLDPNNAVQCSEVKKCGWFTKQEIINNKMFEGTVEIQKDFILSIL